MDGRRIEKELKVHLDNLEKSKNRYITIAKKSAEADMLLDCLRYWRGPQSDLYLN